MVGFRYVRYNQKIIWAERNLNEKKQVGDPVNGIHVVIKEITLQG